MVCFVVLSSNHRMWKCLFWITLGYTVEVFSENWTSSLSLNSTVAERRVLGGGGPLGPLGGWGGAVELFPFLKDPIRQLLWSRTNWILERFTLFKYHSASCVVRMNKELSCCVVALSTLYKVTCGRYKPHTSAQRQLKLSVWVSNRTEQ